MERIHYCKACERYTMSEQCPKCGAAAPQAKPAKYSPEDRWGEYRRKAKAQLKGTDSSE